MKHRLHHAMLMKKDLHHAMLMKKELMKKEYVPTPHQSFPQDRPARVNILRCLQNFMDYKHTHTIKEQMITWYLLSITPRGP